MSQRTERIDELLRQEIGTILSREAKDPRIGFVTITNVETTPDLRHARVWASVIGTSAERREALVALQHAMHFVRRELGPRLRLKRIPELHVELDDSMERGTRLLHLLDELDRGRMPDDTSEVESLPTPVGRIRHEGDAEEPTTEDEPSAASDASGRAATRPQTGRAGESGPGSGSSRSRSRSGRR